MIVLSCAGVTCLTLYDQSLAGKPSPRGLIIFASVVVGVADQKGRARYRIRISREVAPDPMLVRLRLKDEYLFAGRQTKCGLEL